MFLPDLLCSAHRMAYQLATHKIQSSSSLHIDMVQVPKLLGLLTQEWAPQSFVVSFKLETDQRILYSKARTAIQNYGVHVVIANMLQTRAKCCFVVSWSRPTSNTSNTTSTPSTISANTVDKQHAGDGCGASDGAELMGAALVASAHEASAEDGCGTANSSGISSIGTTSKGHIIYQESSTAGTERKQQQQHCNITKLPDGGSITTVHRPAGRSQLEPLLITRIRELHCEHIDRSTVAAGSISTTTTAAAVGSVRGSTLGRVSDNETPYSAAADEELSPTAQSVAAQARKYVDLVTKVSSSDSDPSGPVRSSSAGSGSDFGCSGEGDSGSPLLGLHYSAGFRISPLTLVTLLGVSAAFGAYCMHRFIQRQ